MSITTLLLVLAAGAVGAVVRDAVVSALPRAGTGLVNVGGTLLLAVTVALAGTGVVGPGTAAVLGLGFAGSLTTFSGWVARVDAGLRAAPVRTMVRDVLLPLLAGVAVTVAAFVALG